ncbi:MAG: diguanylate cyclase, partial [Oscillospiraceae bacterium]|nr:diguanylate cyclase [Oscillospiraceae bacterium]
MNVYFENDLALSSMFFIIAWTLGHYVNLERKHIDILLDSVNRDSLTNLYNHRYFHEYLKGYYDKKNHIENPVSLIMMDLDEF